MNTQELYKWGRITLIMLAVFLGVMIAAGLKGLGAAQPFYNSVTVSGHGEAFAVPDVATFSFSVSADAPTVTAAQDAVTQKVNAVLAKLKDLGIDDKDVKTTDYSVWPKYVYTNQVCTNGFCPPTAPKQEGYTANHSVTVKVRKIDDAGKALAAAGDAGATNLSGLTFSVDDPNQVLGEARADAIKDARAKADLLAKNLGVHLGRVVSYTDSTDQGPQPYYVDAMAKGSAAQASTPTIPTGENKSSVTVSVTYEIR